MIQRRFVTSAFWGMLIATVLLLECGAPLDVPVNADIFAVGVDSFQGVYDKTNDKIVLSWENLTGRVFSFYSLVRFSDTTQGGAAVAPKYVIIPGTSTSYRDVPDLERGVYWYSLVPAAVVGEGDTLYGIASDTIEVVGGRGVSFSINNNATYTPTRDVSLIVNDRFGIVSRVRFTNKVKGGKPDFDFVQTDDPDNYNPNRSVSMGGNARQTVQWKLVSGGGNKKVYAVFEFTALSGGGADTASSEIGIAPYKYRVRIANKKKVLIDSIGNDEVQGYRTGPNDATVLYSEFLSGFTVKEEYTFVAPKVEFNVSIGTDTTVEQDFEYWLLFTRGMANVDQATFLATDDESYWYETAPRKGRLTGRSALEHDENTVYEYSVDISTAAGRENLTILSKLDAVESVNGYAGIARTPKVDGVEENSRVFRNLKFSDLINAGRKEFVLVLKFKGKYFGEDRYVALRDELLQPSGLSGSAALQQATTTNTYFDFYRPSVAFVSSQNPKYLNNGDTVSGSFSVYLSQDGAAADKGKSRITDISLIIARKPPAMAWDYLSWKVVEDVPVVAMEDLKTEPFHIFPANLGVPKKSFLEISWQGIDVSNWASGRYFIGVYTEDEYGNGGLAPVTFNKTSHQTNPFLVTVLSGK